MKEHTNDYQLLESDGKPTHVVMGYDYFRMLCKKAAAFDENEDEALIPHEVVRGNLVDGKSMLRAWREHLGMPQRELGERIGVKQSAIAQMERPGHPLQHATLKKLAKGLGISVAQLRE